MWTHRAPGVGVFLVVCALLMHVRAIAEEYKTEFSSVAQARAAGWSEIRGALSKVQAPELSVVTDAAVMDLALPSRWLRMTLVKLNPPAGSAPPLKIQDVSGTRSQAQVRTIHAARFAKPPEVDGDLEESVWGLAQPERDFVVLCRQGESASQQTDVRLGYDDRFLYVGVTAWEKEKKGFETGSSSRRPYHSVPTGCRPPIPTRSGKPSSCEPV
ncbi:MAG: hypothetical protein ABIP48_05650 [Planctomycetota bacterium]